MHDREKAEAVAVAYLTRWGKHYERRTGRKATLEVLARIWNGGPRGWQKMATGKYWAKVKAVLEDGS
jgi:hypothetical protein